MNKKLALTGMFTAFAVVLSYVESFVPPIGIYGAKLGLANMAIVLVIYLIGYKEAVMCNIIRILIIGAMFGNLFSIAYSIAGALISLVIMILLNKFTNLSIVTVSVCGAVSHNIGQLLIASYLMGTSTVLFYVPVLIIAGVITGIIIGCVSMLIFNRTKNLIEIN